MGPIDVLKLLIAASFLAIIQADLKVTQVQVLFRHGEKAPLLKERYPKDIYNASAYEPWGFGQLTNTGKMREYKIGQVLKTRYQTLLDSLHIPDAIYAVSTDIDRTKMSLQLVLAGLFPPSEAQTWNSELKWTPIPTYHVPEPLDIVLKAHSCPQFRDGVSKVLQLPEVQSKIASYEDLFRFLEPKTGLNLTKPAQVYDVYNLLVAQLLVDLDTLVFQRCTIDCRFSYPQKAMNLTLPDWCTNEVFTRMSEVAVLQYEVLAYTTELRRINGGQMVIKFIENMQIDGKQENPRKMYLYSAHETTISAFLRALGIFEIRLPLYGTAVMIEKLRDTEGRLFVRIVVWTGVTEQLITVRLPGCEEVCPIEKFLQLTREVITSDEERDCHWRRLSPGQLRRVFEEKIIKCGWH